MSCILLCAFIGKIIHIIIRELIHSSFVCIEFRVARMKTKFCPSFPNQIKGWEAFPTASLAHVNQPTALFPRMLRSTMKHDGVWGEKFYGDVEGYVSVASVYIGYCTECSNRTFVEHTRCMSFQVWRHEASLRSARGNCPTSTAPRQFCPRSATPKELSPCAMEVGLSLSYSQAIRSE
jgi:hypothetical protein